MRISVLIFMVIFYGCSATKSNTSLVKPLKRVALVIGNRDYKVLKSLKNPINDAVSIKGVLEDLNFNVTLVENLHYRNFEKVLKNFKSKIDNNTIVFFYFAGHANTLQRNSSEEYLSMIEENNKLNLVSLYRLYAMLIEANARYNIVAIDACRNYQEDESSMELERTRGADWREVLFDNGSVLKPNVELDNNYSSSFPPSTLISYATMHNQKAYDASSSDPRHSPYSKALINHLDDEEVPIEVVFKRVRSELIREMNGKQINLEESSLEKNVWLQPKRGKVSLSTAF